MRVARRAPQRAVGDERVGELRRRRLADDDGTGPAQRGDHVPVAVRDPVLERVRAERRAVPGHRRRVPTATGTPCRTPSSSPRQRPRLHPLLPRRASSYQIDVKQLSAGCTSSARASARSTAATGDSSPDAIAAASSWAAGASGSTKAVITAPRRGAPWPSRRPAPVICRPRRMVLSLEGSRGHVRTVPPPVVPTRSATSPRWGG